MDQILFGSVYEYFLNMDTNSENCQIWMIVLGKMIFEFKIVQDYKELKVQMYKPIWDLVFKCNGSGRQFNSIQFSQKYSNLRNERKKKIKQEHKM
jgi:hypothetical protein